MALTIILLTLAGVVISMVTGTIWYMPSTPMGKLHMRYLGFDRLSPEEQKQQMEMARPRMPKMYAGQALLSLLTSFAVAFIVSMSVANGLSAPIAIGFVLFNWLCFMVPVLGQGLIWGNVDRSIVWKKFFSDISYSFVTVVLIGSLAAVVA